VAMLHVRLLMLVPVVMGVSFGARRNGLGNIGSAGLLKSTTQASENAPGRFPVGIRPDGAGPSRRLQKALQTPPQGDSSPRGFPQGARVNAAAPGGFPQGARVDTAVPGGFPQGARVNAAAPGGFPQGARTDVLATRGSFETEPMFPSNLRVETDVHQASEAHKEAGMSSGGVGTAPQIPSLAGSSLFDHKGKARSRDEILSFELELIQRAAANRGGGMAQQKSHSREASDSRVPRQQPGYRRASAFVDDSELGKPLKAPRSPTRLGRVRPDGHEHTSETMAKGFTGLEHGRTVDPHGKEYITHRVTDFLKIQPPDKTPEESVELEGDTHYEATTQERLYHYRVHNTGKDGTVDMVTFSATLPDGSKPHHMYWIRNQRGVQRPEHHDCYVKRLTLTCNIHKLISGQLATVYVHAKQRPSGHGPMHATLTVGSKVLGSLKL